MPRLKQQEAEDAIAVLDDLIPLRDASHADVVEYCVDIPMRYAECFAELTDGRKVALMEPRKFVGWSSHDENRSLLFRNENSTLELDIAPNKQPSLPGKIRNIVFEFLAPRSTNSMKKFIGIDGSVLYQPAG
jgi:hypothetical protein